MILPSLTFERVRPYFTSAYYHRGMSYYEEERVHDLDIQIENNTEIITACVEGSGEEHYQVNIELQGQANQYSIEGICTCPLQTNCKHVVAALLTAIDEHEFILDEITATPEFKEVIPQIKQTASSPFYAIFFQRRKFHLKPSKKL